MASNPLDSHYLTGLNLEQPDHEFPEDSENAPDATIMTTENGAAEMADHFDPEMFDFDNVASDWASMEHSVEPLSGDFRISNLQATNDLASWETCLPENVAPNISMSVGGSYDAGSLFLDSANLMPPFNDPRDTVTAFEPMFMGIPNDSYPDYASTSVSTSGPSLLATVEGDLLQDSLAYSRVDLSHGWESTSFHHENIVASNGCSSSGLGAIVGPLPWRQHDVVDNLRLTPRNPSGETIGFQKSTVGIQYYHNEPGPATKRGKKRASPKASFGPDTPLLKKSKADERLEDIPGYAMFCINPQVPAKPNVNSRKGRPLTHQEILTRERGSCVRCRDRKTKCEWSGTGGPCRECSLALQTGFTEIRGIRLSACLTKFADCRPFGLDKGQLWFGQLPEQNRYRAAMLWTQDHQSHLVGQTRFAFDKASGTRLLDCLDDLVGAKQLATLDHDAQVRLLMLLTILWQSLCFNFRNYGSNYTHFSDLLFYHWTRLAKAVGLYSGEPNGVLLRIKDLILEEIFNEWRRIRDVRPELVRWTSTDLQRTLVRGRSVLSASAGSIKEPVVLLDMLTTELSDILEKFSFRPKGYGLLRSRCIQGSIWKNAERFATLRMGIKCVHVVLPDRNFDFREQPSSFDRLRSYVKDHRRHIMSAATLSMVSQAMDCASGDDKGIAIADMMVQFFSMVR